MIKDLADHKAKDIVNLMGGFNGKTDTSNERKDEIKGTKGVGNINKMASF